MTEPARKPTQNRPSQTPAQQPESQVKRPAPRTSTVRPKPDPGGDDIARERRIDQPQNREITFIEGKRQMVQQHQQKEVQGKWTQRVASQQPTALEAKRAMAEGQQQTRAQSTDRTGQIAATSTQRVSSKQNMVQQHQQTQSQSAAAAASPSKPQGPRR